MKPIEQVYWLRLALGIFAGFVCTGFGVATNSISNNINTDLGRLGTPALMNGIALALITYLISYYVIKWKFVTKVQKPQKLITTGIGVYLLSWIVFWTLFYTIVAGPV